MGSGTTAAATERTADRPPLVAFGPFLFDPTSRILRQSDSELALPPRVLAVLEVLLDRAGDVVARQTLIDLVWKDAFVTDTSLAEAVSVLRQTLGDDPQSPAYIQTVHRRGYRFVAPVTYRGPEPTVQRTRPDAPANDLSSSTISPSIARELVPWSVAIICAIAAITAIWRLTRSVDAYPTAVRYLLSPTPGTTFDPHPPAVAISRDGTRVAWSACDGQSCQLYLRKLSQLDAAPVADTIGARTPFFSPDGRWLGFFADGRLKKIAVDGRSATTLADAPEPAGGTWLDREIVFAPSAFSGLVAVPVTGGEPTPVTEPRQSAGEVRHAWPSFVPSHDLLLFTVQRTVTDPAPGALAVLPLAAAPTPPWRTLIAGVGIARAGSSDLLVFSTVDGLDAVPFDPVRLTVAGEPRTVASGMHSAGGGAHVSIAENGSAVYAAPAAPDGTALIWWTPTATSETARDRPPFRSTSLTPDGRYIAGLLPTADREDLWIAEVDRGATTRITHSGVNTSPVWSSDGRTLYFAARTEGVFDIWSRRVDDGSESIRLYGGERHSFPAALSPDGTTLAFIRPAETTRTDIWLLPLAGSPARPLVAGPFDETAPAFSMRNDLLAYQSAESGRWEVYVRRLGAEHRTLVSTDGGVRPFWSPDGSALYFQSGDRLMRATVVSTASELIAGPVTLVTALNGATVAGIARDGRILLERPTRPPASVVMALDWIREVRLLLGPPQAIMPR
jgi:serine/threonine-protein kinase